MLNVLSAVKLVVSTGVGVGASKIAAKIIKAHAVPDNVFEKITMAGGAWAIGGIVSKAAKKHTDEAVDSVAEVVTEVIKKSKESAKLSRIQSGESTFAKEGLNPDEFIQAGKKKVWMNIKTYRKQQLVNLNAGRITLVGSGLESHITKNDEGKWVLTEDLEDTITLKRGADGVWEEVSLRVKK